MSPRYPSSPVQSWPAPHYYDESGDAGVPAGDVANEAGVGGSVGLERGPLPIGHDKVAPGGVPVSLGDAVTAGAV